MRLYSVHQTDIPMQDCNTHGPGGSNNDEDHHRLTVASACSESFHVKVARKGMAESGRRTFPKISRANMKNVCTWGVCIQRRGDRCKHPVDTFENELKFDPKKPLKNYRTGKPHMLTTSPSLDRTKQKKCQSV